MMPDRVGGGVAVKSRFVLLPVLFLVMLPASAFSALTPDDTGCIRWRDSLIVAGIRSLDRYNTSEAKRYFTAAYECGMSKDSMCYFAAEIYLRRLALDTALVFNRALESSTMFSHELRMEQLARIYRLTSNSRKVDSLQAQVGQKDRWDVFLSCTGLRSALALNTFILLPHHVPISMDPDTEDIGRSYVRLRWTRPRYRQRPPLSVMFDMNSDWGIPTRYCRNEETDTLMQSYGLHFGLGGTKTIPEISAGYRLRLHADGRTDHYDRERITISFGKQGLLSIGREAKRVAGHGLDDGVEELSVMKLQTTKRLRHNWMVSFSHHFAKSYMLRDRLDSISLFRPLPLGFADSLVIGDTSMPYYHFYRDGSMMVPYVLNDTIASDMPEYWNRQPDIYFTMLPEHDINISFKYGCRIRLPFEFSLVMNGSATGVWYPKSVRWFTVVTDNDTLSDGFTRLSAFSFERLYNDCAIIYNVDAEKYYLTLERNADKYYSSSLTELQYHEKTRIDGYFQITTVVEKAFGDYGALFFSAAFLKGVSTMKKDEPAAAINYRWELSAGWKKEISLQQ